MLNCKRLKMCMSYAGSARPPFPDKMSTTTLSYRVSCAEQRIKFYIKVRTPGVSFVVVKNQNGLNKITTRVAEKKKKINF